MFRKILAAMVASLGLSGCEVPVMIAAHQNQGQMTGVFELTFPAMMLVERSDGVDEILTGELLGYANGNATFSVTGSETGLCRGSYTRKTGISTVTCANGFSHTENLGPQRSKMSGVNITSGEVQGVTFVAALGWGNDANEAALRGHIEAFIAEKG